MAFHLNHRKSFDFDFFSLSKVSKKLLEKLSQAITTIDNIAVDSSDELTFFDKEGIKITFLYYPFGHYYPIETFNQNLSIFSVQELSIQKAYTIGRRGEYRDYFDLYTILQQDYTTIDNIIIVAKKVYKGAFDEKIFLQQLVYFDDLLNFDISPINDAPLPSPDQIKHYLEEQVKNYLK